MALGNLRLPAAVTVDVEVDIAGGNGTGRFTVGFGIGGVVFGVAVLETNDEESVVAVSSDPAGDCVLAGEFDRGGFHKGFGATVGFCILLGLGGINGGDFVCGL